MKYTTCQALILFKTLPHSRDTVSLIYPHRHGVRKLALRVEGADSKQGILSCLTHTLRYNKLTYVLYIVQAHTYVRHSSWETFLGSLNCIE